MFKIVSLHRDNKSYFQEALKRSVKFNIMNKSVISKTTETLIVNKLWSRDRIRILKDDNRNIGFVWYSYNNEEIKIHSMYIEQDYAIDTYAEFFNYLQDKYVRKINYICETSKYEDQFSKMGLSKILEVYIMSMSTLEPLELDSSINDKIEFVDFMKNRDEPLRCEIQNEIFDRKGRIPLRVEDISYDTSQKYYLSGGSIFLFYKGKVAGYGQLINESSGCKLVNFGIRKDLRGRGLGLIFLNNIILRARNLGFNKLALQVDKSNLSAIKLYKKAGFNVVKAYDKWEKAL